MKKKILLSILLISCCCYVFTQSCESIDLYEKLQPTKKKGVQFPYKDQFEVTSLEGKSIRLFQNVDEILAFLTSTQITLIQVTQIYFFRYHARCSIILLTIGA